MTSTAKAKAKFRKTAKWKRFRALVKKLSEGKDAVTRSPLRGGFQLHHMDLRPENYENLIVENFCACNRKTHELIHFLFRYYQKDAGVIGRLEEIMKKMGELNG